MSGYRPIVWIVSLLVALSGCTVELTTPGSEPPLVGGVHESPPRTRGKGN